MRGILILTLIVVNPIYRYISIFALAVISFSISQRVALGEKIIKVSNVEEHRVAQKFVWSSRAEGLNPLRSKSLRSFMRSMSRFGLIVPMYRLLENLR